MDCVLCSDDLSPILADSAAWRLVLNRNQNLVGESMPVARRHVEAVDELSADEACGPVRRVGSQQLQVREYGAKQAQLILRPPEGHL